MMYKDTAELPDSIRNSLPADAQKVYMKVFNSAWEQYEADGNIEGHDEMRATAHQVAWDAIREKYEQVNGHWEKK